MNFVDPDGLSPIDTLEIEPAVIVETQVYKAQNEIIEYLPMITYASQADIAWKNRRYGSWAGNIIAGTADGLLFLIGTGKLTKTAKFLSSKSLKHIKK